MEWANQLNTKFSIVEWIRMPASLVDNLSFNWVIELIFSGWDLIYGMCDFCYLDKTLFNMGTLKCYPA